MEFPFRRIFSGTQATEKGGAGSVAEPSEVDLSSSAPTFFGDKRRKSVGKVKNLSIIDSDLRVEGVLNAKGRLVIKGTVKGTITGAAVVIAEEGRVYCDATVEEMTIGGIFEGNIQARERVVILATGRCAGTVSCKDLVVESGGMVNAEVTCTREGDPQEQVKRISPEPTPGKDEKIRQVL
ncbi:polymer-forming cytoskeletal protein [Desulfobotulus sp.]|jgi:cytoskeletal protein CcmA (bactofilin family)|uniref:bactofilin family protein n=1 Tax=Desulfobotulus sp. TaxID=1940337 RepID=UPI002A36597E|nr:polymer-forming cytoskeletal protein [Desulfobotulus sp.]MDY0163738.1 polymer-forming cytoskeletal protein [Desulfobotulus sp.]